MEDDTMTQGRSDSSNQAPFSGVEMAPSETVNILCLCEGSKFAGVERYAATLMRGLTRYNDINLTCALFYDGFYYYRGLLRNQIEENHIKVINLHGKNNLKSIQSIRKILHDHKINLVHFIDLKSTVVGGIAALFVRNVKTVVTLHGRIENPPSLSLKVKHRISLLIYFFLLNFFIDKIIFVSENIGYGLMKMLGSKVKIIHNGLEMEDLELKNTRPSLDPDPYIVGTVGRLEKVKGLTFLLKSVRAILDYRKDVSLYIIGAGPLESQLKEEAKLLGISDKVWFLGFRPDAREIIARMDIFVLSSLHEGIPYVLLEAMALSKPVVCTDVGGIKEVIQNKVDGLLVPPKDPEALCKAILNLLENREYAAELGKKAREKIEAQFSSDLMAKETHRLYNRLIFGAKE